MKQQLFVHGQNQLAERLGAPLTAHVDNGSSKPFSGNFNKLDDLLKKCDFPRNDAFSGVVPVATASVAFTGEGKLHVIDDFAAHFEGRESTC